MTEVKFEFPERPEEGLRETGLFDIFAPFKQMGLAKAEEAGLPSAVSTAADWLTPDGPNLMGIAQALSSPVLKSLPKLRFPKILLKDTPPESNVKLTSVPSNFGLLDGLIKGRYGDWVRGSSINKLESKIPEHRYRKSFEEDLAKMGDKDSPLYRASKMMIDDNWEGTLGAHLPHLSPPMTYAKQSEAVDHEGIHSKIGELARHLDKSPNVENTDTVNNIYEKIANNLWGTRLNNEWSKEAQPLADYLVRMKKYREQDAPHELLTWMNDIISDSKTNNATKGDYRWFLENEGYLGKGDNEGWGRHMSDMKHSYKNIVTRLNNLDETSLDKFLKSGMLPSIRKGNK